MHNLIDATTLTRNNINYYRLNWGGGSARQIACKLISLIQVDSSSKNVIVAIFLFGSFTIDFKIDLCLYTSHFDSLDCPHGIS